MYELGIMMKLRKASTIIMLAIKSTRDWGTIFTANITMLVMNSNNHENAVIWRLTVFILRRLSLDASDNKPWIVSFVSDLEKKGPTTKISKMII